MKRISIVIAAALIGVGLASAQENQSKVLMKENGKNLGLVLAGMAKGDKPYEQAAVDAALAQMDESAKKLPSLYPDSAKGKKPEGDYSPSVKVWDNRNDFNAKIASFAKAIADAKASTKNIDSLKEAIRGLNKECGGCHETFRVKNG